MTETKSSSMTSADTHTSPGAATDQRRVEWASLLVTPESRAPRDGGRLPDLVDLTALGETWQQLHPWPAHETTGQASFVLRDAVQGKGVADGKQTTENKHVETYDGSTWLARFHDARIFEVRNGKTGEFIRFVPAQISTNKQQPYGLRILLTSEAQDGHPLSLACMKTATEALERQWPGPKPVSWTELFPSSSSVAVANSGGKST